MTVSASSPCITGWNHSQFGKLDGIDPEVLIGQVADPILGKQAKLDALLELRARLGLAPAQTLAVGDGANDMLTQAKV